MQSPAPRALPQRTLPGSLAIKTPPAKLHDSHLPDGTHGRLSELQQRFQSFERQVEADTKARKHSEDSTVDGLEKGVQKLGESLAQEVQASSKELSEVQAYLEPKLNDAQSKLEASFLTQFEQIHSAIDALNDRTADVEKDFVQSRSHYIGEMALESAAVDENLSEFRKSYELELQASQDRELKLHQQIEILSTSTTEKLARDEQLSERKYAQLLRDADESVRVRDAIQKRFQEDLEKEVAKLKEALVDVAKARAQADDDIVAALNHYTKELQKALSSVSQGALEAVLRS
mmetsp:Transcript_32328/g.58689  ORF Transcript_32328/g.58689 Transcript_32328/m.58689 type:complete len:290 (-) Transcript_32328:79-948(-)